MTKVNLEDYAIWRAELRVPGSVDRNPSGDISISGFWRLIGAKTKPDYPMCVYRDEGQSAFIFQIGRQRPQNTVQHADAWYEFLTGSWLKCKAVTEASYHSAMETGFWGDGKPSHRMSEEEKLGIDLTPGANAAPVEELLAQQIAEQVEKARGLPEPKTQEEADAATLVVEKLRKLWKLADKARDAEKRPHDDASKAVQAKWLGIMNPADAAGAQLEARRKVYLRKEQERLDAIAAAETQRLRDEAREAAEARRQRLQAEADAVAAAERERLRAEAEAAGFSDEEAAEVSAVEVIQVAMPEIKVAEVEPERARAGGAFSRASGLRKVPVAVVDDASKLAAHLIASGDADFSDYLQRRASSALRGKITLPGCSVREELR